MVGKIIKGWITSLLSSPLAILITIIGLIVLLFVFNSPLKYVQSLFGYETKESLREQLTVEKANNTALISVGKQDKTDIKILEKTSENVQTAIENKEKAAVKVRDKVEKIISDSQLTVDKIKQENIPEEEIVRKVSQERMNSVWKTYCEFNESPECQSVAPTTIPGA